MSLVTNIGQVLNLLEELHLTSFNVVPYIMSFFCLIEIPCDDGDIRLVEGTSEYNGRVEICISGDYYTICDSRWTSADASVTCRQLGYDSQGKHNRQGGSMRSSTMDKNVEHPTSTYLCT